MKKDVINGISEKIRIMSTQAVMRSQIISDKLNINPTDLESIEILYRIGKATAGMLAQQTGLTTGAITGVIDRLVKAGFAKREYDPDDRRKVYVNLNLKNIIEQIIPLYNSISKSFDNLLKNYSDKELIFINDFLKKSILLSDEDLKDLKNK